MLQGDPKVVAALAIAVLAVSPVVNAIMAKAAEQADADLLRDADAPFPLRPAEGMFQPREGEPREGDGRGEPPPGAEGEAPAPAPPPEEEPCEPDVRGPGVRVVPGPGSPTGVQDNLTLTVERGDLRVHLLVQAENVVGRPRFEVLREGELLLDHEEMHVRDTFTWPPEELRSVPAPVPGETWTLAWSTGTAMYDGLAFTLVAEFCAGGSP